MPKKSSTGQKPVMSESIKPSSSRKPTKKARKSLTSLANEILASIISLLSAKDIGNLRRTCLALRDVAGLQMCHTLTLSPTEESLKKIKGVSENDVLCQGVHTLKIDLTMYQGVYSIPNIGYGQKVLWDLEGERIRQAHAILDAWHVLKGAAKKKCSRQELDKLAASVHLPKNRIEELRGKDCKKVLGEWNTTLYKHTKNWERQCGKQNKFGKQCEEKEEYYQGIEGYAAMWKKQHSIATEGQHLEVLRRASPKLRFRTVIIGCFLQVRNSIAKRHNKWWPAWCLNRTIPHQLLRPVFEADQILNVVLENCKLEELITIDEGSVGLMLKFAKALNKQLSPGLQPLKKLEIGVDCPHELLPCDDQVKLLSEELPTFLSKMQSLEQLSILGPWGRLFATKLQLDKWTGNVYLPKLRSLTIKNFSLSLEDLRVLFSRHRSTLLRFVGDHLKLRDGTWAAAVNVVRENSELLRFSADELLEVNDDIMLISGRRSHREITKKKWKVEYEFYVFKDTEVEEYVLHGGLNPFEHGQLMQLSETEEE